MSWGRRKRETTTVDTILECDEEKCLPTGEYEQKPQWSSKHVVARSEVRTFQAEWKAQSGDTLAQLLQMSVVNRSE